MIREISSIEEFYEIISKLGKEFIFRGQTEHYMTESGKPKIETSFDRKGCVPSLMQKWNFYCREALLSLKGPDWNEGIELSECQAVLQHYGWRSFFLDFSSDFKVAAWFGSHVYSDNYNIAIVEDWQETGLLAFHLVTKYLDHSGFGYVYIVSKEVLSAAKIGTTELFRFRFSDFESRIDRQKAVMVGPLSSLPEKTIVQILKIPVDILFKVSSDLSQSHLFPSRDSDLIYKILLSVPFVSKKQSGSAIEDFGSYASELAIPEYDYSFNKRPDPYNAFYQPRYIFGPDSEGFKEGVFVKAPDSFLYHTEVALSDYIGDVLLLMGTSTKLIIETDGILRLPTHSEDTFYLKGVVIEKVSDVLICISGLKINHPGLVFAGYGVDLGWNYRTDNGKCLRRPSKSDCTCNNNRKHMLELSIVLKLQYAIEHGLIKQNNRCYIIS